MIAYYNSINLSDDRILSCDGVRIKFQIDPFGKSLQEFSSRFFSSIRPDIDNYPISLKENTYKYLAKITYGENSSMTIGFCFNGCTRITENGFDNNLVGFLDFNLNKVGSFGQFWNDYGYVKSCSNHFECLRVDIALDVKSNRENIILEKDKRKYSCDIYSAKNKTEYLGRRSNIGFVKVYNKQIESNLDYPLTRIEVTCELDTMSYLTYFPKVYDIEHIGQTDISIMELEPSNRAILEIENELLINGLDYGLVKFHQFSKYIKQKLKPYLLPESSLLGLPCGLILNNYIESLRDSLRL